jgi:hypothetical protein
MVRCRACRRLVTTAGSRRVQHDYAKVRHDYAKVRHDYVSVRLVEAAEDQAQR